MMYLARQLGYQAQPISGGVGPNNTDHAWVTIDGRIYDPEYDRMRSMRNHGYDYNLYDVLPANAPFQYYFPK